MARRSPVQDYAPAPVQDGFAASTSTFTEILGWLGQDQTVLTHAEIEDRLDIEGRELLRQMYQDRLDLCAERERRLVEVADADGALRGTAEPGRERALATMFGQVMVTRIAYRARGLPDLHPADAVLNLPAETHSHGLRRLAAVEATRGSFADAATTPGRSWPDGPASWPPRSAAKPPTMAWTPAGARPPTRARPTCWPRSLTWTIPPPWPPAGPSPPASSKAPADTWSRTGWTSPAPAGASTAPKLSYAYAP